MKEAIEASFKLLIRKGDMNVKIPWFGNKDVYIKDIVYIETCNRNLKIHLKKQSLVICETIREMKKVLEKKGFVSPHQSFLVNLDYVDFVRDNSVVLKNGEKIPLSRKRKKEIKEKYINWCIKQMSY